jgi:MFS family permease
VTVTSARRPAVLLAVGVVALEFAAAVSTFVSSTLLPTVARELAARDSLALLVTGSMLGLFVALPLAPAVLGRLGPGRTLGAGLVGYVGGAALAAAAPTALAYAAGRFAGGLGGGLLAVFGVSAVIRHLDGDLRVRVVAASSAMWIVPAFVGPPGTLALEHAVGWRWAVLAPVPIVLAGRVLVVRAVRGMPAAEEAEETETRRPAGWTLLVPLGVATLVLTSAGGRWWPLSAAGAAVALAGMTRLMPAGTARGRRGTPAALAAMLLFATGWFGADSLVTVLLTDGYQTSLARAGVVLSAAPLAWAVTSLLVPRLVRGGRPPRRRSAWRSPPPGSRCWPPVRCCGPASRRRSPRGRWPAWGSGWRTRGCTCWRPPRTRSCRRRSWRPR